MGGVEGRGGVGWTLPGTVLQVEYFVQKEGLTSRLESSVRDMPDVRDGIQSDEREDHVCPDVYLVLTRQRGRRG